MSLFEPLALRSLTARNRIIVSPMCMYSAIDGVPQAWHQVHLGSRAVGGAAVVMAEATAVEARGRISPEDTGLWNDTQADAWTPMTAFIREQGAIAGIQLAHAGRKAGTRAPWRGRGQVALEEGGWEAVAPSALAFAEADRPPQALSISDIDDLISAFRAAAQRALDCGFQLVEIHGAHGYLLHQFMSPLSNLRSDRYGGSFDNRIRLTLDVIRAVREVWPEKLPLLLRISATDWVEGGWDIEQSVQLSAQLKPLGVDMVDVSSGGLAAAAVINAGPGYQLAFAERIRRVSGMATAAVGMITEPAQADSIIRSGQADMVMLAREMLRDPYWPRRAARILGASITAPAQYERAW